jgi:hypothetical protein
MHADVLLGRRTKDIKPRVLHNIPADGVMIHAAVDTVMGQWVWMMPLEVIQARSRTRKVGTGRL